MRLWITTAILLTLGSSICHAQNIITTFAGTGTCCNAADGPATSVWLALPGGLTFDSSGNLYIWETGSSKIRRVTPSGALTTFAGNGTAGFGGDGGPATSAELFASTGVPGLAADSHGNIYISDGNNHRVRKVDTSGNITTVAGNGTGGFSGDGGQAINAMLFYPAGLAVDKAGNLYIADSSNSRVRKVDSSGVITTYAGNGHVVYEGDNVLATTTAVDSPEGLALDGHGNLYISETSDSRVRRVDTAGVITTVAGQTSKKLSGFSGDGGLATAAALKGPRGLTVDRAGNLYIADNQNGRIRRVDAAGIITTYAGNGTNGYSGDGGPATSAAIGVITDVAVDSAGNLYMTASGGGAHRVREVSADTNGVTADPSSLSFAYTIGDAVPAAQTINLTSASGALSFVASASSTSGTNWLSVTPASGSTPAVLSVSINPAGIPGGAYQGAITVTPSGGTAQSFAVTLTVTGAGAPTFKNAASVVNALGYQNKLAPDTVFVIFGAGMGPASIATAAGPNYPISLAGTSVTFTPAAGGAAVNAKMVYSLDRQIAGLLPSSVAPGTYAVRVIYNGLTSAPQNVTVVPRSLGIATANSAGSGTAQATIGNVNGGISLVRFTSGSVAFGGRSWTLSPAHPGDTLVLWGTGGGADAANDTGGTSGDQTKAGNFVVNIGGRQITPLYAGASSGFPGLWQVNFTLPSDIATSCFATAQVSAGGELSNAVMIPIAAKGQDACSDATLSKDALARLDAGGTVSIGGVGVAKGTSTFSIIQTPGSAPTVTSASQEGISATFLKLSADAYAFLFGLPKVDACTISDTTGFRPAISYFDAGSIAASGPGLPAGSVLGAIAGPVYDLPLTNGTLVNGGKYTIDGNGGKDVGAFEASINFPSGFNVTNWDAITMIDRTKPLVINWTGGDDKVDIIIGTSRVTGKDANNTNIVHAVALTCEVPAAPGTYSVPVAALAYLLPEGIDTASLAGGSGTLAVNAFNNTPFTPPLTAGGQVDYSGITATLGVSKNLAVQ